MRCHELGGRAQRMARRNCRSAFGHHCADGGFARVFSLRGAAQHNVAVGHNAGHAVVVRNRQTADVVYAHEFRGFLDGLRTFHRHGIGAHCVFHQHSGSLHFGRKRHIVRFGFEFADFAACAAREAPRAFRACGTGREAQTRFSKRVCVLKTAGEPPAVPRDLCAPPKTARRRPHSRARMH